MKSRIRLLGHAMLLGWYDPLRAVLTWRRPVPVNEKLTRVWAQSLTRRIGARLVPLEGAELLTDRRCLYFFPHRSFADLFLHKEITRGLGATLSRAGMGVAFPLTWLTTRTDRSTWFFRRDKRRGVRAFFEWLDREFDLCPLNGLIVYPEGTRNRSEQPLPLKGGMIHYAFSRGLPIQVIATHRTERVVNEAEWTYHYDQAVPYRIEPPIDPADYEDRRSFHARVEEVFGRAFREVTVGPLPGVEPPSPDR
ncbi:MAG: hypothetical protein Q9Q40_14075 [Acidobacteriota bacterium]|nr:hypothetical protein [Acidobacteriota bacterium]MDQ7086902.1 hypothetical protein [Acidobacteriota bacterium]